MADRRGITLTVPQLPEPAYDVGPAKNRWPLTDEIVPLAAAQAKGKKGLLIDAMPWDGWIEIARNLDGSFPTGWYVGSAQHPANKVIQAVGMLPCPEGGRLRCVAPDDAVGDLRIICWTYEAGLVRVSSGVFNTDRQPTKSDIERLECDPDADGSPVIVTPPAGTLYTDVTKDPDEDTADVKVGAHPGDILGLDYYAVLTQGSIGESIRLPGAGQFEFLGNNGDIVIVQFSKG
jgi:hypothetical protein